MRLATTNTRSSAHEAVPATCSPLPLGGSKTTEVTRGMVISTTRTRRYCTTVTTRSSAPSSRETATTPEAPPATRAKTPVVADTSRRSARTRPARMLSSRVASVTDRTAPASVSIRRRVAMSTREPTVIPINPCATRKDHSGRTSGVSEVSAWAIPPSTAAKSTAEGTPSRPSSTLPATVTTTTSVAACRGLRGIARACSLIPRTLGRGGGPRASRWRPSCFEVAAAARSRHLDGRRAPPRRTTSATSTDDDRHLAGRAVGRGCGAG